MFGRSNRKLMIYGVAIVLMLICSGYTSPLYPHYIGVDSSIFLTIAKGMVNGKMPYVDLFDHKGPVFFSMEALGYFLGGRTGVFLFQCVLFCIDLFFIDRIARLFRSDFLTATAAFASLFFTLFQYGDLTEEFSTPLILSAMYFELKFLKSDKALHEPGFSFFYGIILGLLAFIRLNNAVIHCMLIFCIVLVLAGRKQYRNLVQNIHFGILGLAAVAIPVCLYYYMHGALYDMLYGTFLHNLGYTKNSSHISMLSNPLKYLLLFMPGICSLSVFLYKWKKEGGRVYVSLFFTTVLTYGLLVYTNAFRHYFMLGVPLFSAAAAVIGGETSLISALRPMKDRFLRKGKSKPYASYIVSSLLTAVTICYMAVSAFSVWEPVYWTYLSDRAFSEYSQIQTGVSIIPEEERGSVIAYNVQAGFYYHADILPCYRYFALQKWMTTERLNVSSIFMDYIKTSHPLWVITYAGESDEELLNILRGNYTPVFSDDQYLIYRYQAQKN